MAQRIINLGDVELKPFGHGRELPGMGHAPVS